MPTANPTATTYEELKKRILSGAISPSESLPEVDLAKQYGVSRSTIKKVLMMLERESLVTIEPNKGAKVRSYSIEEVREFLELRGTLEGFIARLTVPVIADAQIEQMGDILSAMKMHLDNRRLLEYSDSNRLFHGVIYDACPNRTAVEMTINLKNKMSKYNTKTILVPGRDVQSFSEHTQILEAIRNRNSELTEVLMRHHIANVCKTFIENYRLLF